MQQEKITHLDRVAAIDGVLHVAQNMGETDLMTSRQFLLTGIAVGDPDLGTVPLAYSPIRFHESPIYELDPPPAIGEHTDAILGDLLGMNSEQISALRSDGAVV